ncbi:hypothetical protein QYF36_023695 [Acer negundo]|nr:hypothetical protein QYF36_023695 [Acer negundo]
MDPQDDVPLVFVHRPSTSHSKIVYPLISTSLTHLTRPIQLTSSVATPTPNAVGVDHLDLSDCRRGGIAITNAGVAFSEDVADLAVGLLIDVLCGISAADRFVRSGFWANTGDYPLGFKLGGNWDCGIGKYWLSSCKET